MNESEAKFIAIKTTAYCDALAQAWEGAIGDSVRLARIPSNSEGSERC
jgi:hypothetical protein